MLLRELVQTSEAVAATSGRTAKITEIAGLLRRASAAEVPAVVAFLSGDLLQRQIGVGYASLGELLRLEPSGQPLTVAETGLTRLERELGRLVAALPPRS